jgi:hypothetical protein
MADNDVYLNAVVLPESFPLQMSRLFRRHRKTKFLVIQLHQKTWRISITLLKHRQGFQFRFRKRIAPAVCVLPSFAGSVCSSFSTTPLYDGGTAGCFRAWTSHSMIWLFPGKEVPLTSANARKFLECTDRAARFGMSPGLKYFSS